MPSGDGELTVPDNIDFVIKPFGTPETEKLLLKTLNVRSMTKSMIAIRNIDSMFL